VELVLGAASPQYVEGWDGPTVWVRLLLCGRCLGSVHCISSSDSSDTGSRDVMTQTTTQQQRRSDVPGASCWCAGAGRGSHAQGRMWRAISKCNHTMLCDVIQHGSLGCRWGFPFVINNVRWPLVLILVGNDTLVVSERVYV
jgi:hypothetical protein